MLKVTVWLGCALCSQVDRMLALLATRQFFLLRCDDFHSGTSLKGFVTETVKQA